jgi:hypothetical protein
MNWPISAMRNFDFMLVIRTVRKGLYVPYWELENMWSAEETGIWRLFIGDKNELRVLLKCKQAQIRRKIFLTINNCIY